MGENFYHPPQAVPLLSTPHGGVKEGLLEANASH
jgi:hypothetical protein